ncbi:hypothetical protein KM92DES2_10173 [uncultured Desulfovibrio sp.]|uniref:Uncharacterized protein n=1 Tax=uncultured Desulfovibrio sp. TaxID=167968 RepID=A0A212IX27_9BACT|nr:hypothetical protein KM92DES2_10173 [uncultured Desulfovibrio sp.]
MDINARLKKAWNGKTLKHMLPPKT